MAAMNGRQAGRSLSRQHVGAADQQPTERRKCLGKPEHPFAASRLGKQLSQPGDRGNKLDADANEHQASQEQQLREAGGISRGASGHRIKKDAEREDATTAETVREVTTEQAEDPTCESGNEEKGPSPFNVSR